MARRNWEQLSERTRKRYTSAGRKQGLDPTGVRQHYESGASIRAWEGHRARPGVTESQWRRLRAAAKAARLDQDVEGDMNVVLESLLSKGLPFEWILKHLAEKKESRDTYRTTRTRVLRNQGADAGWQPGRRRYYSRLLWADIELYYYH